MLKYCFEITNKIGKEIGIYKAMNICERVLILAICIITFTSRFQVGIPTAFKKKRKAVCKTRFSVVSFSV